MSLAGEIRLFAGNVAPGGWAFCHGQSVSIAAAPALFEAIGTTYGGDGRTTFALPDLRGRVPVHRSSRIAVGAEGGAEVVALNADAIPNHQHAIRVGGGTAGDGKSTGIALVANRSSDSEGGSRSVSLGITSSTGDGNAHANVQPFLCLNYIIALETTEATGPFVGEVRLFAGEQAPAGWTPCNGQSVTLQRYGGLYSVIGTTYGGDGRTSFSLPDLRGRVAIQAGHRHGLSARRLGETGGSATVDLDESQLPAHTHDVVAHAAAGKGSAPAGTTAVLRTTDRLDDDGDRPPVRLATGTTGKGAPHLNLQPYLALNACIAVSGRLPEPN